MTPRRLILNIAVGAILTALVILVLFAHLSTLVKPEGERVTIEQEIEFRSVT